MAERKSKKKIMECIQVINEIKKNIPERTIEKTIEVANKIIKTLKIKKYPVPIVKILNDLGFLVVVSDMPNKNISGFIIIGEEVKDKTGNDKVIGVSMHDTVERQRFTLAHEFAHYLFDFNENKEICFFNTYDIGQADTDEEKIPSRFAAEFLMPKDMFVKRYKELDNLTRYEKINQLIIDFNTTQKSVIKRFEELNLN